MSNLFNDIQVEFIKNNVVGVSNKDLTERINARFGLNVTIQQVKKFKSHNKLRSGLTGHFSKGHVPVNKGTKGLFNVGGNRTSYKKGDVPQNYKPVGFERIDNDGYVLMKVRDDGPWNHRWIHKHRVVWEQANGPIPKGHCIIFMDQNKQNVTLENLRLVKRGQLGILNQKGLLTGSKELNETGIAITNVYSTIRERKGK